MNATGLPENAAAARTGGGFARKARQEMETLTEQPVVTAENALPPKARKPAKALGPTSEPENDDS
jgi:hypothetical protein